MLDLLSALRRKVAIGFVGGSDLIKQQEQLGTQSIPVTSLFDFCFAENGLTAYRMGEALPSNSFIKWIGEDRYKQLVRFLLHYMADLEVPVKRGTFIEFRNGMINVSPVGRNASQQERDDYEKFDLANGVRKTMIEAIKKEFSDLDLVYVLACCLSFERWSTDRTVTGTPSEVKSLSTSSPRAGISVTACSISRMRRTCREGLSTRQSTSSETRLSRVVMTSRSMRIRELWDTASKTRSRR